MAKRFGMKKALAGVAGLMLALGAAGTAEAASSAAAAEYIVVAVAYEHANYGGESYELWARPCDTTGTQYINDLGGWNNHISSIDIRGSRCVVTLFSGTYAGGYRKSFYGDSSYVGNDFNDRARSLTFSKF
ncbi:hypothetical protein AB0D49_04725 [Streptomyces sp. NPDC048290]|uniref:hypothetical protein n=1 Tax=Streptomyces sp. NPDC048290 TaxID=3155811 RepID=UPI003426EC71